MSAAGVLDVVRRWAEAEGAGDSSGLDELATPDFLGVGPVGFVLDRDQWRRRFADGLVVTELTITDVRVREHGDVAVALGVQTQSATYREHPNDGRFRLSMTLHRHDGRWVVLGLHLSGPMPPGAPA